MSIWVGGGWMVRSVGIGKLSHAETRAPRAAKCKMYTLRANPYGPRAGRYVWRGTDPGYVASCNHYDNYYYYTLGKLQLGRVCWNKPIRCIGRSR
jgi:hypothetical protein